MEKSLELEFRYKCNENLCLSYTLGQDKYNPEGRVDVSEHEEHAHDVQDGCQVINDMQVTFYIIASLFTLKYLINVH